MEESFAKIGGRRMPQVRLIPGYAALAVSALSIIRFVVLPVLGCGFCGISGGSASLLQE
jgi:hypothetical protein